MRTGLALRLIDVKVKGPSFLALGKIALFAMHVCVFLSLHSLLYLFVRNEKKRLRLIVKSNAFHAKIVMKYLGLESFHEEGMTPVRGKLIVCNHLSYLDVLVLFTLYPALFITSKEIERTPVLGQITKLAGCFFVERRKTKLTPEVLEAEMKLMKRRLSEGFNIFLFPEGTSTDGSVVLPFKAHFFQLAIDTNTIIQPVSLKYIGNNRKLAPWYGDMSFLPHFYQVCRENRFSVVSNRLPYVPPAGMTKFELKDVCHQLIRESYERN